MYREGFAGVKARLQRSLVCRGRRVVRGPLAYREPTNDHCQQDDEPAKCGADSFGRQPLAKNHPNQHAEKRQPQKGKGDPPVNACRTQLSRKSRQRIQRDDRQRGSNSAFCVDTGKQHQCWDDQKTATHP